MLNITDLTKEQKHPPLLRLGFRTFFLFGSLFSLISMLIWLLLLTGKVTLTPYGGSFWWHAHEMMFGFVTAIVAGFLLTAVQTWTNIPGVKGSQLLLLLLLWLAARLLLLFNPAIPPMVIMATDLLFLPVTALFLATSIVRIRQYRNMIFIPLLLCMTITNLMTYLPQIGFSADLFQRGVQGMVLLVTFLVALIGGRVIPMFTANGTGTTKVLTLKWLELACMLSLFATFILLIFGLAHQLVWFGWLCFTSAALHCYRQLRWRPWVTVKTPLVWSLHVTMLFIPLGLFMIGIHFVSRAVTLSNALHCLTVGTIGGMIIAMMSRVSLGHTGRKLVAGKVMQFAFASIVLAAMVRSILVAVWPQHSLYLWIVSGTLWCVTFSCFIWVYTPILTRARVDGRPG